MLQAFVVMFALYRIAILRTRRCFALQSNQCCVRKRDPLRRMDGHDSEGPKQSTADMTAYVQNLLQQMQSRFQTMSDSIVTKIDEMGSRINELEQSISDLRTEMGVEGSPSPSPIATPNPNPIEVKKEEPSA